MCPVEAKQCISPLLRPYAHETFRIAPGSSFGFSVQGWLAGKPSTFVVLPAFQDFHFRHVLTARDVAQALTQTYLGLYLYSNHSMHHASSIHFFRTQFYVNVEKEEWKLDTLCDLYETLAITQSVIFANTRRKVRG